ncbi:MAG: deoxyribonuclease IV [Planctomycetaceae bacterium]|nr:deoxyribonuclease IV [bacterium]MDG2391080.1 deoxyribonuclease IV [Planctomycetaceae bacterium]
MPLLGAHMSIAGGYYKAVEAAAKFDMDCVQIFTKNNNQWRAKPIVDEDVRLFREAMDETGIQKPCAHASYLINLASPKDELWEKSIESFVIELKRAEQFGLLGVVLHPGSYVSSSPEEGLARIVAALDEIHRRAPGLTTQTWLETTAGQGTNLGYQFEELQYLLENVNDAERLGVCLDTCHIFAAGYAMGTKAEYEATFKKLDSTIGLDHLKGFHLNDSKKEFGSRVDRHEHIGEGFLGLEPFRHLLNDKRFTNHPMYMETPKEQEDREMDPVNLKTLRALLKSAPARKK